MPPDSFDIDNKIVIFDDFKRGIHVTQFAYIPEQYYFHENSRILWINMVKKYW